MKLKIFEERLGKVMERVDELGFSDLLRLCRLACGLSQCGASELTGIGAARLKNLETGFFRAFPRHREIEMLAALWGIEESVLYAKAKKQVRKNALPRKIPRKIQNLSPEPSMLVVWGN